MARMLRQIRARFGRQFSLAALGPNEARILYDGAIGTCALVVSLGFKAAFLPDSLHGNWSQDLLLLLLPAFNVSFNGLFGVYSSLKRASGRIKALALMGSVCVSCVCGWLAAGKLAPVLLWGLIVYGPLALPRIVLGLSHSKHKRLAAVVVNARGPVLVIGGAG